MSLIEQETLEDVTGWLLQNKALAKSPEYRQKASLYMALKTEKPKEGEAVEDLSVWLRSNKDKRSTSEYKSKAIQYMGLKKEAGTNVTGTDAFARGVVQGATFEFYDEAKAAALAAADYLTDNPSDQSFSQLYGTRKKKEDELLSAYKEKESGTYLSGQISGSVATLPLGGLFGKAGQVLFGVGGRGATAGGTAVRAGTAGAAQAGLAGFGAGEDLESRFISAATGVGIGGVLGGSLGAGGYKLAEKIANSSNGLVARAAGLGAAPKSTIAVTEELEPQLVRVAQQAAASRNAAYTSWRDKLNAAVGSSKTKFFKDEGEDGAYQVIPTGAIKSLVNGMQSLVTDQKNINGILQEGKNVTVDTYRNLYKTAWDLQKQLPPNKGVPFAKKLKDLEGFEYRHLDSLFPSSKVGTARKALDTSVRNFETGQLLNEQLVSKLAKGEALDATFARQFLPNNSASFDKYTALKTRVNSWAKEAGVSPKEVDEILAPLRANAMSDAINDPKLLGALAKKGTSEQLTLLRHYKELLTPEQFAFVNKLSKMPTNHLQSRMTSLLDYYSSTALLGLGGIGGATALAGGGAGLAVLGIYMASPILANTVTKNKQLMALATKIVSAPTDTPPKELLNMTNSLGKAALKAGIITPATAITTLQTLTQAQQQQQ